jgi:tyrosine-protein phosphatase SIW14
MSRWLRFTLGVLLTLLLVCGPVAYGFYRQSQIRNLRVVEDGVLYRSGQMSLKGLKHAIHDLGIRTVISLRPGDSALEIEEENFCRGQELNYERIAPNQWRGGNGGARLQDAAKIFCRVMDDPANYPVLIHCYRGVHRTGAICAVYRMEYENWSNAQAIEELHAAGYKDLEDEFDLLGELENFVPRWKREQQPHPER